jgi:hypothetical protein
MPSLLFAISSERSKQDESMRLIGEVEGKMLCWSMTLSTRPERSAKQRRFERKGAKIRKSRVYHAVLSVRLTKTLKIRAGGNCSIDTIPLKQRLKDKGADRVNIVCEGDPKDPRQ